MAKKLRALLTGLFHETNTYVPPGDLSGFPRTAGQDLIDQNRDGNTPHVVYIDFCDKKRLKLEAMNKAKNQDAAIEVQKNVEAIKTTLIDFADKNMESR